MIKIRGLDFRAVVLQDMGDRIYFNQVKIFTAQQIASSKDLAEAVKLNRVAILEGELPPLVAQVTDALQEVRAEMVRLAEKVESNPVKEEAPSKEGAPKLEDTPEAMSAITALSQQVADLQKAFERQGSDTIRVVQETAQRVEKQVSGLSVTGSMGLPLKMQENPNELSYKEETYVPATIVVTDMSNHVKLDTQQVGMGDKAQASLNKLRNMKKQTQ